MLMLFDAPKYRGPKSDHFDGRRFLNLRPTAHAGFLDLVKWLAHRELTPDVRFEILQPGGVFAP